MATAAVQTLGLLGVAPTTLSKDIHKLREELLSKKLKLQREQQLQNDAEDASSSSSSKPTVSLADFLPDAGGESWRDEPSAVLEHASRMETLQSELAAEQAKVAQLKSQLTELNTAATADKKTLSLMLRSPDLQLHSQPGSAAAFSQEEDVRRRAEAKLAAKREQLDDLERQAVEAEAMLARAKAEKAAVARIAEKAASRALMLRTGSSISRWDAETRTLRDCQVSLVADDRCFQAVDSVASTSRQPLLLPLHLVEYIGPFEQQKSGLASGLTTVPSHAWLYFTIRWRPAATTAELSTIVSVSPSNGPQEAHFACLTRREATQWIVGLAEAAGMGKVRPLGSVLWHQVRAMLEEEARTKGKRPMQVLTAAILHAAADKRLIGGTAKGDERAAQSMFFSAVVQQQAAAATAPKSSRSGSARGRAKPISARTGAPAVSAPTVEHASSVPPPASIVPPAVSTATSAPPPPTSAEMSAPPMPIPPPMPTPPSMPTPPPMPTAKPGWGIEAVLASAKGVEALRAFCKSECSEENLHFLIDARAWAAEYNAVEPEVRSRRAKEIVHLYLASGASMEVSLPAGLEGDFMGPVSLSMFDRAMDAAHKTLVLDIFPRFEETDEGRKLKLDVDAAAPPPPPLANKPVGDTSAPPERGLETPLETPQSTPNTSNRAKPKRKRRIKSQAPAA